MIDPFDDPEYVRLWKIWYAKGETHNKIWEAGMENFVITEPLKPGKNPKGLSSEESREMIDKLFKAQDEITEAKKNLDDYFYDNEEYFDGDK